MPLTAKDLKTVGTAVAVIIFAVPLVGLFISLNSWEPDTSGARRPRPVSRRPRRPRLPPPRKKTEPLTIKLKRQGSNKVRVILRNTSSRTMTIAIPGAPGHLIVVCAAGAKPERKPGPLFDDEERDDYVMPLKPGNEQLVLLKNPEGFPEGPLNAVYDSRGEGMPKGAWQGRAESNPAKKPAAQKPRAAKTGEN